jgi:tetratricopeptide (TPR) repeat protein
VTNLIVGLISALLATNQLEATTNLLKQTTGLSIDVAEPGDPVEKEYKKLLEEDDHAHDEIDKWIREAGAFEAKGAAAPTITLNAKIEQRQKEVKKLYEEFIEKHPTHAKVRLAYGSFLSDMKDEEGAAQQWEKSLELDRKNPAAWNDVANIYGHDGRVKKAFEYYAKAIELNPNESLYYQNMATTVYLFRKDAMEFYNISEQEVFDKALDLYRKAVKLKPTDFPLYSDYAQSFYGTNPPRWEDGLKAWEGALKIARDEVERQGVLVHIARCKINIGRFDEAAKDLKAVTNSMYLDLKLRLQRKLDKELTLPR